MVQKEMLGTLARVPEIYTNIYHLYMDLFNGCIGQYGVMFGEQLLFGTLPSVPNISLWMFGNPPVPSISYGIDAEYPSLSH